MNNASHRGQIEPSPMPSTSSRSIPRTLHQIYLKGALPPKLQEHVDAIRAKNRHWQHALYDTENGELFIRKYYGQKVQSAFRSIDHEYGAARADLLRYLIMYKLGGVYLDIKSGADAPLDSVLLPSDQYIISQWRNGPGDVHAGFGLHRELSWIERGEFQIFFIACAPEHPFLRAVIDYVLQRIATYRPWSSVGRNGVLRTTGPIAYTLAIAPLLSAYPHRRVANESVLGLYPSITDGYQHGEFFPKHYSTLQRPVVKLSPFGEWLSRHIHGLKSWAKHSRNILPTAAITI